uniref:Uncharacterized protein LOC104235889 n=1 Tax=Nicotiana sylvestris TaxID=4096 RepID=A0A1U7XM48_NICSY|nr:PREDICTED: uncharacterized protein LOC104235889 [Nicotiana sylvestris]
MTLSQDNEQQKHVMGYPSISKYNQSIKQGFPSQYDSNQLYNSFSQGYILPIQGYPNPNPNPNLYVSSSSNYPSNKYVTMAAYNPMEEQNNGSSSFGRLMVILMLILVVGMIMLSLVFWLFFGTEGPVFHILALSVPSFRIINSSIVGNWQVNLTMCNMNDHSKIKVFHGKTSIFYKTNLLAVTPFDPVRLEVKGTKNMLSNLTTLPEGNVLDQLAISEISKDKNDGDIEFSLEISLKVVLASDSEWQSHKMMVYCNNLKVKFGPEDRGELVAADKIKCLIVG